MKIQTTTASHLIKEIESVYTQILIAREVWAVQDQRFLTPGIKEAREQKYLELCAKYLGLKTELSDHQQTIKALIELDLIFEVKNGLIYV